MEEFPQPAVLWALNRSCHAYAEQSSERGQVKADRYH
jgi:hypothetical protein